MLLNIVSNYANKKKIVLTMSNKIYYPIPLYFIHFIQKDQLQFTNILAQLHLLYLDSTIKKNNKKKKTKTTARTRDKKKKKKKNNHKMQACNRNHMNEMTEIYYNGNLQFVLKDVQKNVHDQYSDQLKMNHSRY